MTCDELVKEIKKLRDELVKRYQEMREDKYNMYTNNLTGLMSWEGHQKQFLDNLTKIIVEIMDINYQMMLGSGLLHLLRENLHQSIQTSVLVLIGQHLNR